MATAPRRPDASSEEFARRGDEIYERDIFPKVGPADQGMVVVIEVESGDYEIDKDEVAAGERLRARHPHALFWLRRVGSRHLHRFGHHRSTAA
jgi:hypothetical protein